MRRAGSARRRLLFCQKLGGQLPTLPTRHLRPWLNTINLKMSDRIKSASISIIPDAETEGSRSNLLDHQMIVDGVLNQEKKDPTKWTKIVSKETNYTLENVEIATKTGAKLTTNTFPVPSLKIKEEIIETYILSQKIPR